MQYRLGKKQNRALLDENGIEVALFKKGHEELAARVCEFLSPSIDIAIGDIWSVPYAGTELFRVIGIDWDNSSATFKYTRGGEIKTHNFKYIKRHCSFVRAKRKCIFF